MAFLHAFVDKIKIVGFILKCIIEDLGATICAFLISAWRRLRKIIIATFYCTEILFIIFLWFLYFRYHQAWEDNKYRSYNNYYRSSSTFRSSLDPAMLAYDRVLPSGRKIRINNNGARFKGDMINHDSLDSRLFPDFAQSLTFIRQKKLSFMPSISMIHFKLKREDDQLIEAMQLEMQQRLITLLHAFDDALTTPSTKVALSTAGREAALDYVHAARQLAGESLPPSPSDSASAQLIREFDASRMSSFGLAIDAAEAARRYTRRPDLTRVFRTQRFLMSPLKPEAAQALLLVLQAEPALCATLEGVNRELEIWDNPPATPHLLSAFQHPASIANNPDPSFLPWAQSPENRYYAKRFGDGPLPPQFNWMDEIIAGIRNGQLNSTPRPESGWYDYKFYALTPLVSNDQSFPISVGKLDCTPTYHHFREDTFRASLIGLRETHLIRISPRVSGLFGDSDGPITLAPQFGCEPEPTFYWRIAEAYRFMHDHLPANSSAARRAGELQDITRSLAALNLLELGLPADGLPGWSLNEPGALQREAHKAEAWLKRLPQDPVFREDPRVTLLGTGSRQWGTIGVRLRKLTYEYLTGPQVEGANVHRQKVSYYTPVLVGAEFSRRLNGKTFRELCDQYDHVKPCLAALGVPDPDTDEWQISVPLFLGFLTVLVALHLYWMKWSKTRRRLQEYASRSWARRWSLRLVKITAVACMVVLIPPFLLLHVLPRIDLPRQHRIMYSGVLSMRLEWHESRYGDGALKTFLYELEYRVCRKIRVWALHSDSFAVRENALCSFDLYDEYICDYYYKDDFLDICMKRGYDEVMQCFPMLVSMIPVNRDWDDHQHEHPPEVKKKIDADLHKVRLILDRFNDPEMILKCGLLFELEGSPEDFARMEDALQRYLMYRNINAGPISDSIHALIEYRTDQLPYDRLIDLGIVPAKVDDLAKQDIRRLIILMRGVKSHLYSCRYQLDPQKKMYESDPRYYNYYRRAITDKRMGDLLFYCNR